MDRCYEVAWSLAEQLDQPMLNWWRSYTRGWRAQFAGDVEEAERLATEALELGTDSGQPDATMFFGAQLMMVSIQRGTMGELVPLIEQMAADAPEIAGGIAAALALAHVEADRIDDARHLLEEFAAADFDLPLDPVWLTGMVGYADAAAECRDPKYAGPLFDRLAPWADQFSITGVNADGPVSHCLGGLATVLGRYDEADAYFTQAAAFNDRVGAKFFAARTNLSWGKMLAERKARATPRRLGTFSPKRTPPQRPTDTRTSNDARPKSCSTWSDRAWLSDSRKCARAPSHSGQDALMALIALRWISPREAG